MALDIKREMAALDSRNYNFYENLTEEEKKSLSPYVLMRYASNVQGDTELAEWFLETTNEMVNKNFGALSKHKELLWKLLAGTGVGVKCFHPYIPLGKKEKTHKIEKLIEELNPSMKLTEVKLLASMMTKDDIETLFNDLGFDKKQRKAYE